MWTQTKEQKRESPGNEAINMRLSLECASTRRNKSRQMSAPGAICLIFTVIFTTLLRDISGGVINVATGVSVKFACTGPDPPTWFVNGRAAVTEGVCYTSRLRTAGGPNYTATLVINGNRICDTFDVYCRIYSGQQALYLHNTTLRVQGALPSPENVALSSQRFSVRQLQWKPPYYTMNQGSDIIDIDPHITQYTVYTVDAYTRKMIGNELNTTETNFTLRNNISDRGLCPIYQVSAWNAGDEGELSEPVYESALQVPRSIAAENISISFIAESDGLHIQVGVDVACNSKVPEFFLITLMTTAGGVFGELNMTHEPGEAVADFTISLPQSVDVCSLHVRISAGNSAGMSPPSEPVEVVCSGGITESTTSVSTTVGTTVSTTDTESGNMQQQDSTMLIAIFTGVAASIVGVLIVVIIIGIICCRSYKTRHRKAGHVDNDYSESPSLGGPVPLYQPPTPAADLVYVNNEQTTGRQVASNSESTSVWTQSSDTPPSTDSEGSNDNLLQPSPPAPVGSPHLVYAQLESVKLTQVQPPSSDEPVQYAQIEHQD